MFQRLHLAPGNIVEQNHQPKPPVPPLTHAGDDSTLRKLPLHGPDGFEDVLEGAEMVEGVLPLAPSKPELSHLGEQRSFVEREREYLMDGHAYEP